MGHIIAISIVVLAIIIVVIRSRITHFECTNCGHAFKVSSLKYIFTLHAGFSRYVTCPNCHTSGMMLPKRDKK